MRISRTAQRRRWRPRLGLSCPSTFGGGRDGEADGGGAWPTVCNAALPDYTINATCIQIGAFQLPSECLRVCLPVCLCVCATSAIHKIQIHLRLHSLAMWNWLRGFCEEQTLPDPLPSSPPSLSFSFCPWTLCAICFPWAFASLRKLHKQRKEMKTAASGKDAQGAKYKLHLDKNYMQIRFVFDF